MATAIPTNLASFTLHDLLVITGGRLLARGAEEVVGVSTDTRSIAAGNLFVALVGARHDGHDHVAMAAERGAVALLVSRPVEAPAGVSVLLVEDTLRALGALGRAHRRRWEASTPTGRTVIGITGSAGKTTTRVAVAAALRAAGISAHASRGNLNNAVGIPMVLLGLTDEHEVAVVEVGTSSRGEIAYGCSLIEQHTGIVTLVGAAHTENIGTIDDVAHEKGFMFATLPRGGTAIGNADDLRVRAQLFRTPVERWITYGEAADADVRILGRRPGGLASSRLRLSFSKRVSSKVRHEGVVSEVEFETPLLGIAGAYACAAAFAAVASQVTFLDERMEKIAGALGVIEGEDGRLRAVRGADDTVLVDDCYNANRASTVASLRAAAELARAEGRRLVAVLGEMLELGALSADEHRIVGQEVAAQGAAALVAVQGDAAEIARAAAAGGIDACFVPDAPAALEAIRGQLRPGDLLLVKGSRGVGLDLLVRALKSPPGS
jgi:UDP-N-acetylmuramoyl-tripeptide--D-alanyl-D-alanine ligase